jgi:hypothetical protein
MEEREFFDEKQEKKPASLNCPHCHQAADYEVTWVVRTKKRQLSGRADERDRARFAKFRSYMVRNRNLSRNLISYISARHVWSFILTGFAVAA